LIHEKISEVNSKSFINVFLIAVFFILFSLVYLLLSVYVFPPKGNNFSYNDNNMNVLGASVPADLNFCGEKIPSGNLRIRDELNREFFSSSKWKSKYQVLAEKTRRWFPYIEPILKEEGVPDDFKYVAVIESNLSNAMSVAGAAGFWQLVPVTASAYGLEVNEQVDERFHVEKATRVACRHIKDAYAVFKNWTLAAAAYNRGIGGIQKALENQMTDNYFNLLLNRETGRFVYRILAYKTLLAYPTHFGIKNNAKKAYLPISFSIFKIDSSVNNFSDLALHLKTEAQTIFNFNPWLRKKELVNRKGKVYELRIPKNKKNDYSAYINDLRPVTLDVEQRSIETTDEVPEFDTSDKISTVVYIVKQDELVKNLAANLNISEEELRKLNKLGETVVKGQTVTVSYGK
jgi:membrane-bound lytic murein transglycosylase D